MAGLKPEGCLSHSCCVQRPKGLGTNGPCTCYEGRDSYIRFQKLAQWANSLERANRDLIRQMYKVNEGTDVELHFPMRYHEPVKRILELIGDVDP